MVRGSDKKGDPNEKIPENGGRSAHSILRTASGSKRRVAGARKTAGGRRAEGMAGKQLLCRYALDRHKKLRHEGKDKGLARLAGRRFLCGSPVVCGRGGKAGLEVCGQPFY